LAAPAVFEAVFGFFFVVLAFTVFALDVFAFFLVFFAATRGFLAFWGAVFTAAFFFVLLADFALAPTFFAGFLALSFFVADFFAIKSCPPKKSNIQSRPVGGCHFLNRATQISKNIVNF
jgi:hypothetical protein